MNSFGQLAIRILILAWGEVATMRALLLLGWLTTAATFQTYLSNLAGAPPIPSTRPQAPPASAPASSPPSGGGVIHAPLPYFAIDQLTEKGPRKGADDGDPRDATRPLASDGGLASGSWWCSAGGWPSPNLRPTSEMFYVLSGHGMLTNRDGTRACFGPGDVVVLPKGWSGRWDILVDIHKIWFVHDHPSFDSPGMGDRCYVIYHKDLAASTLYDVGPTALYVTEWAPGESAALCSTAFLTAASNDFSPLADAATTRGFHVLEGAFFLTGADGATATRCVAGDTVLLPRGFTGTVDVLETGARALAVRASY